ncbi:MAG: GNAT family N-acetyltransferase [Devosia sp.]
MALPGAEVFERAGLKAWPGIEVEWDGGWVRRAAGGYTQRANSVQSLNPADQDDAEARIAKSVAWFRARDLRPIFRVTPLAGPRVVIALDAAGWQSVDHSQMWAMELGAVETDLSDSIYDLLDPAFVQAQQKLQGYTEERTARMRALLEVVESPGKGIVVYSEEGEPVASALMVVADGIVITGNVVTGAAHRRMGYGAAMMRCGLAWARSAGATIAALNVASDNGAAQALYRGLGYSRQYDYIYRLPETG